MRNNNNSASVTTMTCPTMTTTTIEQQWQRLETRRVSNLGCVFFLDFLYSLLVPMTIYNYYDNDQRKLKLEGLGEGREGRRTGLEMRLEPCQWYVFFFFNLFFFSPNVIYSYVYRTIISTKTTLTTRISHLR
jgi:hypothetical protein